MSRRSAADYSDRNSNDPTLNISLDGTANDGGIGGAGVADENDNVQDVEVVRSFGTVGGGHILSASSVSYPVTLIGANGADSITGGSGHDCLVGGNGDDTLVGNAGDDTLLGQANEDSLLGGDGNDVLYAQSDGDILSGGNDLDTINYGSRAEGLTIDLDSSTVGLDTISSFENVIGTYGSDAINGNSGNNVLAGGPGDDDVDGEGGDDVINVLGSGGSVTVAGGSGNDTLHFLDDLNTGAGTYTVASTTISRVSGTTVGFGTVESLSITAGEGTDTIDIESAPSANPVTVTGGAGLDDVDVNSDSSGTVKVEFVGSEVLGSLSVRSGGTLIAMEQPTPNTGAGSIKVSSLTVDSGGLIDLTNNSMIIDYTGAVGTLVGDVRQHLQSGRMTTSIGTFGSYNTTMGYGDNAISILQRTTFAGQSVDNSSILIKFTYEGDHDLNGMVDIADLGMVSTNWQTSQPWTGGDFDYNGTVDINDLGLLASNWQAGTSGGTLFVGGDPEEEFLEGIKELELSEDEIAKLLEELGEGGGEAL